MGDAMITQIINGSRIEKLPVIVDETTSRADVYEFFTISSELFSNKYLEEEKAVELFTKQIFIQVLERIVADDGNFISILKEEEEIERTTRDIYENSIFYGSDENMTWNALALLKRLFLDFKKEVRVECRPAVVLLMEIMKPIQTKRGVSR